MLERFNEVRVVSLGGRCIVHADEAENCAVGRNGYELQCERRHVLDGD